MEHSCLQINVVFHLLFQVLDVLLKSIILLLLHLYCVVKFVAHLLLVIGPSLLLFE